MYFVISLILNFFCFLSLTQSTQSFEHNLTGGVKKRWVFSKTKLSMGTQIELNAQSEYISIIFSQNNKSYFGIKSQNNLSTKGKYEVIESAPEEHFLVIGTVKYEAIIYNEKKDGKPKEVLLLRLLPNSKQELTKEYFFYAE